MGRGGDSYQNWYEPVLHLVTVNEMGQCNQNWRLTFGDPETAPLSKHVSNNLSHKCQISTVITQHFAHFATLALDHRHVECSCFVGKARQHTKFVGRKD